MIQLDPLPVLNLGGLVIAVAVLWSRMRTAEREVDRLRSRMHRHLNDHVAHRWHDGRDR